MKKPSPRSFALGVLMFCTLPLAHADAQRDRIAAERTAANARFEEQQRVCVGRFVVTACVDAARKEQRATLSTLRREQQALDDAERRDAAARRQADLQQRATTAEARASEASPERARGSVEDVPRPAPNPSPAPIVTQRRASSAAERRAVEQQNESDYAARLRSAQAHREAVERRNAQRSREGKVAAPLPSPSSASAPWP